MYTTTLLCTVSLDVDSLNFGSTLVTLYAFTIFEFKFFLLPSRVLSSSALKPSPATRPHKKNGGLGTLLF